MSNKTHQLNDYTGHTYLMEILNSLYVPNGCERLISPQHWEQNTKYDSADDNILDDTNGVTPHDCTTLVWGVILFVQTMLV